MVLVHNIEKKIKISLEIIKLAIPTIGEMGVIPKIFRNKQMKKCITLTYSESHASSE